MSERKPYHSQVATRIEFGLKVKDFAFLTIAKAAKFGERKVLLCR
jgi:hypothetical protein